MTSHDLIENQTIRAFAGAQRASKYIETAATPTEPPATAAAQEAPTIEPDADLPTCAEAVSGAKCDGELYPEVDNVDLGTLSITHAPCVARTGVRGMLARHGMKVPLRAAPQQRSTLRR